MILTLTANPSIDHTIVLDTPLRPGEVQRAAKVRQDPGGKGINVARVLYSAGREVCAVLPADQGDPILAGLDAIGLPYRRVPLGAAVRTNMTLSDPDGRTTKINELGPALSPASIADLARVLADQARGAEWVVLSGSLPPGVDPAWYAELVVALRPLGVKVAVDTSDAPLRALAAAFPGAAPDVIKPNAEELAQLTGTRGDHLEAAAAAGDPSASVAAADSLVAAGVGAVLVTLGGAGAALVTARGAWWGTPPPISLRSTVGAGDSAIAGYLIAESQGFDEPERLRQAIAHGSAAAALAGTQLPRPDQLAAERVQLTRLR